jgi:hypothetical protein
MLRFATSGAGETSLCSTEQRKEEFEDTKGVIRMRKSKRTDNAIAQITRTKGQTTIYKTLHIKLKIKEHEPYRDWKEIGSSARVSSSCSTSGKP